MKKVKITNGVYGYCKPGTKRPDPKHAGDVVDLPDEEAARLVCLKVGVILGDALEGAGGAVATPSEAESTASPGVDRDGGGQGADRHGCSHAQGEGQRKPPLPPSVVICHKSSPLHIGRNGSIEFLFDADEHPLNAVGHQEHQQDRHAGRAVIVPLQGI